MAEEDDDAQVVHPQWRAWVAENLARGAGADELDRLGSRLQNQGVALADGLTPPESRKTLAAADQADDGDIVLF